MNDYQKSIDWPYMTKSVQEISYKWLIQILLLACIQLFLSYLCFYHSSRNSQNRLLKVCCVPATSTGLPRVSFFFSFLFLLQQPFTILIKQASQAVRAIKQSIYSQMSMVLTSPVLSTRNKEKAHFSKCQFSFKRFRKIRSTRLDFRPWEIGAATSTKVALHLLTFCCNALKIILSRMPTKPFWSIIKFNQLNFHVSHSQAKPDNVWTL